MGNKGTKDRVDQLLQIADRSGKEDTTSREELVGCLASIADMASTGHGTALPSGVAAGDVVGGASRAIQPGDLLKTNTKLRRRLESLRGTGEDLEMIDTLVGNEDSEDWASMRSWLVWCMHANLDENSDDSPPIPATRRHLNRQTSMDLAQPRLKTQENFDVNPRDERMSAQTSLESNAET